MRGVDQHCNVITGNPLTQGQHFFAVRIILSVVAKNYIFCGVSKERGEGSLVGFCENGMNGVSFYGTGNTYPGNVPYGRGTAPSGSTVGIFLDLDNKFVRFEVNGWAGENKPLDDGPYYFHCSLYSQFDAIELLPELCWHK